MVTDLAERVGFEPTEAFTSTDFECVRLVGRRRKIQVNSRSSKTLGNLEKRGFPTSFVLYALQGKGIRAVTEFAQISGKWRELGKNGENWADNERASKRILNLFCNHRKITC